MANADAYLPPRETTQPLLNSIPDYLLPRFDPVFVEHHNKNQRGRLHTHQVPIEWYRADPQKYAIIWGRETFPNAKVRISEEKCPVKDGEIGIRVYERVDSDAPGDKRPVYMNFHGGGWVFGNLDTDQEFCKMIAHKLGCVVFDVDYRLAPEFRHPTQVQDTWAAFQWMRQQKSEEYKLDLDRVAVGGASAGGHLAAVVGLKCRDAGIPLAFQVLHVPVCDMHVFTPNGELREDCSYPSYKELWETVALSGERMTYFHNHFLGNPRPKEFENEWEISPIRHPNLAGLAAAFIATAEMDPLRDEGEAYGKKLREAGNQVEVWRAPGVPHTFGILGGVLETGRQFNKKVVEELAKAFGVSVLA
ncbi:esterase [Phyllosticta citricarpa]|uniref:Esterase n=1 Tax=Phyllosticta citricarpa TaxID=55181 RepID=A0ABR1LG49_9PEZI